MAFQKGLSWYNRSSLSTHLHSRKSHVSWLRICWWEKDLHSLSSQPGQHGLCKASRIYDISGWMASSQLKLNPSKTELMWLSFNKFLKATITVDSVVVKPSKLTKNLGVTFDEEWASLALHVSNIRRACHYQLWLRYLRFDTASTLVHLYVSSRIVYCNSLLASAPLYEVDQLQRILN